MMTEYNSLKNEKPFAIASQYWDMGECWQEEIAREEITIENLNNLNGAVWADPINFYDGPFRKPHKKRQG